MTQLLTLDPTPSPQVSTGQSPTVHNQSSFTSGLAYADYFSAVLTSEIDERMRRDRESAFTKAHWEYIYLYEVTTYQTPHTRRTNSLLLPSPRLPSNTDVGERDGMFLIWDRAGTNDMAPDLLFSNGKFDPEWKVYEFRNADSFRTNSSLTFCKNQDPLILPFRSVSGKFQVHDDTDPTLLKLPPHYMYGSYGFYEKP